MKLNPIVATLYDAYNSHDVGAVERLYAADATHEDIASGQVKKGAGAIAEGLGKFFGWFPDAHWEPCSQIDDANGWVAITYRLSATLQKPMGPIPARNQKISLRGIHVLRFEGGLIRHSEDYWDGGTFTRQLNDNLMEKQG